MTITARNYAAQAKTGLLQQAKLSADRHADQQDRDSDPIAISMTTTAELIDTAIHFVLPDNGKIFDDGLRGIRGQVIRLPFPVITIEWLERTPGMKDLAGITQPVKNVLVAAEYSSTDGLPDYILAFSAYQLSDYPWQLSPAAYKFSSSWDSLIPDDVNNAIPCDASILPGFESCSEYVDMWHKNGQLVMSADTLLEFIEALSCSNVSHEPIERIDPRKNAKRIKAGKLPIYETRILTIEAGKSAQSGQTYSGSHASPRQHLRRGHIRRLADKNIWVNSCVVGKAETGVIEKQYHVKAA